MQNQIEYKIFEAAPADAERILNRLAAGWQLAHVGPGAEASKMRIVTARVKQATADVIEINPVAYDATGAPEVAPDTITAGTTPCDGYLEPDGQAA